MKKRFFIFIALASVFLFTCDNSIISGSIPIISETPTVLTSVHAAGPGVRGSTPANYIPSAPGKVVYKNSATMIDVSNSSQGYFMADYFGSCPKVKMQVTGPNNITYTYTLGRSLDSFPLPAGNGGYTIAVYENVSGNQYSTCLSQRINVSLSNPFGAFLYPNQYVNFSPATQTAAKAAELASTANNDLDVVSNIYNYIIKSVKYDYSKASSVQSGYLPNVDSTLVTNTGICFDYAALMTAMLRSQNIPTRLEIGYAGSAYHAWVSTYIKDVGWVDGMIQFNGTSWVLMDPTFAANTNAKTLRSFIGNGKNYVTKFIY